MYDKTLIGTSMVLTLDGQKRTGTIADVQPSHLVVRVPIQVMASGHQRLVGSAILPGDGRVVSLDLSRTAYYTELTVEVPLPTADTEAAASPEQERRKFYRLAVQFPITVVENVTYNKEAVRVEGTTVNMSGGGLLVNFQRPVVPGIYKFRLALPGDETLVFAGRILRKQMASETIVPVEFVDMHESDRSKLIRLIFFRMRAIKLGQPLEEMYGQEAVAPPEPAKADDAPRYWRRREKFYKPNRIRYW